MTDIPRARVRIEQSPKRVRVHLGADIVADTTTPMLVWEKPYYPTYYFPVADVHAKLAPTGETIHSTSRGEAEVYDVSTPNHTAVRAASRFTDSPVAELRDLVRLNWADMDEWFEEDEPVYVHPRDPYKRVDILASSRHIVMEVDGVVVAESRQPRILFETGLPPRYYLPLTDVRMELLRPSTRQTQCPYKGTATYWSVVAGDAVHEDLVWCYRSPTPESQKIIGLASFYNERVDLYVDEVLQERPRTPFS